jgi:hypothetical protein
LQAAGHLVPAVGIGPAGGVLVPFCPGGELLRVRFELDLLDDLDVSDADHVTVVVLDVEGVAAAQTSLGAGVPEVGFERGLAPGNRLGARREAAGGFR